MRLLESLRIKKVSPSWRYKPGQLIWRVVPTSTGKLFGESRDIAARTVTFFCLDLETGRVLWENRKFGQGWWTGIEAVQGDRAFLHGFSKPDLPAHKGIVAVDLHEGKELWERPDLSFLAFSPDHLLALVQEPEGGKILELDSTTGREGRRWIEGEEPPPFENGADEEGIEFPVPLSVADRVRPGLASRLAGCFAAGLPTEVEVIERHDRLVVHHTAISGTRPEGEQTMQTLLSILAPETGDILYQEVLNSRTTRLVPDAFFRNGTMIISIQDRTTLIAVRIP